ncbi:MAG TPA: S9 family peptidase [Verrucomicrobiae bacterium]|nr:S9 family peptidase [Verrucomicrobiae bacterium]
MRNVPWILLVTLVVSPISAQRKPAAPDDLWLWRTTSSPQVSPDSKWVAYVETWNDRDQNAVHSNVWIATANGRDRYAFSPGPWRDSSPRWSPDSARLAWISDRGEKPQVYVRQLSGDRDLQLTTVPQGVRAIAWSPDGGSLAIVTATAVKGSEPAWAPPELLPRVIQTASELQQIALVGSGGGTLQELSRGEFKHWSEPAWMPNGQTILAIADRSAIYSFRRDDASMKQLTHDPGVYEDVLPAPDGSKMAWLMTSAQPRNYSVRHLYVMNMDGTRLRGLAGTLERDVSDPQWSNDSRTVYFLADDQGSTHIYATFNDGSLREITKRNERLRDFSMAPNGRAAAVRSSSTEGSDVVTFAIDLPGGVASLAAPNDHLLAERTWEPPEEIHYPSAGNQVQAWLVKPPHFDPAKTYPLILDIQDAPRAMYGTEFQLRAQILAAQGFVVLCANPRGTPGYGETFGELLHSRFPGDDAEDLLKGVDFVASKGYIDAKRIYVAGGLVAAWIIGHSERFNSAVLRHAISDWTADILTSPDGGYRASHWMGGWPWDDPEQYIKHSPLFFAANFKTPTLVLAGESDVESEEIYGALRQRGVKSALVRVNDKPADQVLALQATIAWLSH